MTDADGNARILVAEDVQTISLWIRRILEARGWEVAVAEDGEQCLEMARDLLPDVIILDIMMPKMHGIEVLKQLKSDDRLKDIGVIVCTSKDFATELNLVQELGAEAVINKPIDQNELVSNVRRLTGQGESAGGAPARDEVRTPDGDAGCFRHELDVSVPHVRLWGTRGSIPISDPECLRHGGNTSCLEFEYGPERIIFDAGSGIRNLGMSLMSGDSRRIHLFITHTHWDHIQGFPFFAPAYVPGFEITVYAAKGFDQGIESVFRGQLHQDYFPVQMDAMQARLSFRTLDLDPVEIGDVRVTWEYAQHPGATVGYKIEAAGKQVAYFPDNEFLQGYTGSPHEVRREDEMVASYEKVIEFLSNVDVLVHEAQYTSDEYIQKIGWGHSSVPNACLLAKLANVRRWIVTHHDPMHKDAFLQDKLNLTRQLLKELEHPIEVFHGYDGMIEYL